MTMTMTMIPYKSFRSTYRVHYGTYRRMPEGKDGREGSKEVREGNVPACSAACPPAGPTGAVVFAR